MELPIGVLLTQSSESFDSWQMSNRSWLKQDNAARLPNPSSVDGLRSLADLVAKAAGKRSILLASSPGLARDGWIDALIRGRREMPLGAATGRWFVARKQPVVRRGGTYLTNMDDRTPELVAASVINWRPCSTVHAIAVRALPDNFLWISEAAGGTLADCLRACGTFELAKSMFFEYITSEAGMMCAYLPDIHVVAISDLP